MFCKYCNTKENLSTQKRNGIVKEIKICKECKSTIARERIKTQYNTGVRIPKRKIKIKQCKQCGTFSDLMICFHHGKERKWNICRTCHRERVSVNMKKDWAKGNRNNDKFIENSKATRFREGIIPHNKGLRKETNSSMFKASTTQKEQYKNGRKVWMETVSKDNPVYNSVIQKLKTYKLGYKCSDEQKHNMAIGQRKRWVNQSNEDRFSSSIEVKFEKHLIESRIKYYHSYLITDISNPYLCDFYLPDYKTIIECDGTYWHNYPFGNIKDHIRNKELVSKGYTVLRYWEFEINKKGFKFTPSSIKYWKKDKLNRLKYLDSRTCLPLPF